jgi:hypothetical protein
VMTAGLAPSPTAPADVPVVAPADGSDG